MTVIVHSIEFDTRATQVVVGWVEFDIRAGAPAEIVAQESETLIGGRARRSVATFKAAPAPAKTSPASDTSYYHSRAYEQEQARAALELDDEEITLAFLMEFSLHV